MNIKALVLLFLATEAAVRKPLISSKEEAEYIALDTTRSLLPDPILVQKIEKDVALIRKQFPEVANTVYQGRKYTGKLKISEFSKDVEDKINRSKFGPIVSGKDGVIQFKEHFNPDVLSREIKKLTGVSADPIWIRPPDFGDIEYNRDDLTYTFREGLENCKPKCTANNYYIYQINSNGQITFDGEQATDIEY
ncbi:unnamed protein product [Allacma fusca]|uniref:Uncharacterized protein n=1 Tax=Allacma fusca TaxID=39272 RepID=A0A8J2PNQ3_9HEXA|nr:unnamed protein product [Allacma fusca]